MIEITKENLTKEVLKKPKAIVDFWASWCGPCTQFAPIYKKVADDMPNISFCKLNIEDFREIAMEFGVMSIPTIIFFKNGEEVGRFTGSIPENSFREKINEFLA